MANAKARRLFRSGMLDSLATFFPAGVTLQNVTLTRDAYGEPAEAWADDDELIELRGQLMPATEDKLRMLGLTLEKTTHILGLAGHYPDITPAMRVLVDDGASELAYTIRGVRHDSGGLRTYLGLSRVVGSAGDVGV